MPTYIYADHGDLAPYLAYYPGLFGLYDSNAYVTNKSTLKRGSCRDNGFIWTSSRSRFSSPSTSAPSSSQSTSPYLYTFYDDSSSTTSPYSSPQYLSPPKPAPRRPQPQKADTHTSTRPRRNTQSGRPIEVEIRYEPPRPLRRSKANPSLPRVTPLNVTQDHPQTRPSKPSPQRSNAVRRETKQRPPLIQTDPATPLPSLVRLDRLLETISSLIATISNICPPSVYAPRPLPKSLQSELTDLQPYLSITERELLPDQNFASRWSSSFRLFSGPKSAYDSYAKGATDASSAARWRALQRITREPHTAPRREFVSSIIAVLTVQTLVRRLLRLVDWRGRDFGHPKTKATQPAYKNLHSYRATPARKRAQTAPAVDFSKEKPRVVVSRWAEDSRAGEELDMPTPLALRVRRLERMDLRLQRVLVAYGEAVWGGKADVGAWLAWVKEILVFEGFLR